ncbi:MAG: hypothetical protein JNL82_03875 [Myxococcales bacterium]|nr:hypothetical protein [Myxococcales bacterium]
MFDRRLPVVILAYLSACTGEPETSNLEKRGASAKPADSKPAAPAPAKPASEAPSAPVAGKTDAAPVAGKTDAAPGTLTAEPPPGTELVPMRLALKDASVYRMTTIGNVQMSGLSSQTAYAREEQLELDECSGEGDARRCRLTHRYRKFEAEPPAGKVYETDEKQVSDLVTRHTLLASGAREGATEVLGPADRVATAPARALADVHRFFCIRFPAAPIGVGAKWRDTCHMRTGGTVDTRDVVWELSKLHTVDGMRRAELTYLGEHRTPGPKGELKGTVSGILHFIVDAGEPHLIREVIQQKIGDSGAATVTTTLAYQFTRIIKDKAGNEKVVRTDGAVFPGLEQPTKAADKPKPPANP